MDQDAKLSEDQRRQIELNRQRALEKGRERRQNNIEKENWSQTSSSLQREPTAAATTTDNVDSKPAAARESSAAGEMDRLLASTSGSAANQPNNASFSGTTYRAEGNCFDYGEDAEYFQNDQGGGSLLDGKRQKMAHKEPATQTAAQQPKRNHRDSKQSGLTEEQRTRIEENRRRALEKKQMRLQLSQGPIRTQIPAASNSSIQCPSPTIYSDDQRARVEKNRLEALEKRQKLSQIVAAPSAPVLPSKNTVQCQSPNICNDEQRARMERNRLQALQRKQQMSHLATTATSSTSALPSSTQCPSPAVATTNNAHCPLHPSPTITDDQRQRMEMNRRKALERKQQMSQLALSQHDVHDSSLPSPAPEKMKAVATSGVDLYEAVFPKEQQQQQPTCPVNDEQLNYGAFSYTEEQGAPVVEEIPQQLEPKEEKCPDVSIPDDILPDPPAQELAAASSLSPSKLVNSEEEQAAPPSSKKKSALPPIPPELQYEEARVLPINDDDIDTLIENAELDEPLLNGWSLYDHQKEGVLRALRMRRLILAFDMGLGKTIIGCVWAKAFRNTFAGLKVFVVAPVSLHDDWKRTATEATGLKVNSGGGKKSKKGKPKKKKQKEVMTVTGKRKKKAKKLDSDSDSDTSEDESVSSDNFDLCILSWSSVQASKNILADISDYVVICDEAHSMQSMSSKRTEEALKLVFPKKCRGVLLLSGTPMKNGRPSNLFPLLRAVKHPFGDNQRRYEFYFCNGQQRMLRGAMVWDASGSSNLKELNGHTATHIFRMTKEECMSKELPPRKREFRQLPVSPRHELRYTQALKDLAEAFSFGSGKENDEILSSVQKLRQISSHGKVDAVVALADKIVAEESSIVIFTSFVAVAKEIYHQLEGQQWGGELLTGETAPKNRQSMVDRFQSGLSPVFVCTYGVGGVGLTLTAACTVILVDRPWTPGDVCQAEDRVRRIGQKRPVRSIWLRAFPIDKQIDDLLDHKDMNSSTAVDGKDHGGRNKSAPKVSIAQLVKSVLSNENNERK